MTFVRTSEDGSATVYGLIVMTVVGLVTSAVMVIAGVTRMSHEAARAADLAAIAGSQASLRGDDGCGVASRVAERNSAVITQCDEQHGIVTITVEMRTPRILGQVWKAEVTSRAAPSHRY